ncbi:ROK family transcriptional regulator [Amycolatopsis cynarae]|uniref:ROK family transcriptional regulator n=1 Tax=Amycolatopsis cynarae TaxID=2995223 RepID=A0ABY7AYC4_9PSEU|nr:ROK family transcriptional regulator [Amycolatopsis sp. HUAS 11-8]WAL64033.1 ROK family transcriptional regulator [Amycolatopsis sp. HUAS 11-8]
MESSRVGAGAKAMRRHNLALVMNLIARSAPVSRVELAERAGLTKATVSALVTELISAELVRDLGPAPGGAPGRPAGRLVLDPYGPVAMGLQFGADFAAATLLDLSGRPLARHVRRFDVAAVPAAEGARAARPVLRRLFEEATLAGRLVAGIGITVGGTVSPGPRGRPVVTWAPALRWRDVDVIGLVSAQLRELDLHGLDVRLAGEVACAALAEYQAGAAGDWLYLGGEDVIGLAPLNPALTLAGDLGHVPVRRRGEPCPCGNRGCLDRYAGRAAMAAAAGLAGPGPSRLLGDEDAVTGLIRRGDPAARRARDTAADALADALVPVRALLAPDTVVLGGRLGAFGEPLLRRVQDRLPGLVLRQAKLGADAALHGAAGSVIARVIADPLTWIDG